MHGVINHCVTRIILKHQGNRVHSRLEQYRRIADSHGIPLGTRLLDAELLSQENAVEAALHR